MDDELGLHAKHFKRKGVGYNLSDIKSIKAQSEEMKKLIGELERLISCEIQCAELEDIYTCKMAF